MSKGKKGTRASSGMGSIRKRADGRWEARYTAPNKHQKSVYGKTEKEVTAKLRIALHEMDTGIWRDPSKVTVEEWLNIWLSDYQTHNSERTVLKYTCIVNKHFIPKLGDLKLTQVLPVHIMHVITTLNATLAPITTKNYICILGAAFQCAIEAGLIRSNPVDNAKLPRIPPTNLNIIDRTDIPAFMNAARTTPYPNELIFMLLTGLRIGEIRGLRWGDCDLEGATVNIQRQLHPNHHGLSRFTPPKYGEARKFHIAPEAVTILRDQRRRQAEQRIASGQWEDDDITSNLVFRMTNGKAHTDSSIYDAVKVVGKIIGQPKLHPHDLRHSYAIAALRAGADIKTVQYNLGHKTAEMTLNVYAAYTEDAGKASAKKLSEYLKTTPKTSD